MRMQVWLKWLKRRLRKKISYRGLSKRQLFVVLTLVLTGLLVVTQLTQQEVQNSSIVLLAGATYVIGIIALRGDLRGIEYLVLFILPVFFTVAVSLFYFLLPPRLLTRLPIAVLYAIGMYAILLTENIYNVAAARTIQLLRAAQSVGFLITLVTAFFLNDAIFSLHRGALFNAVAVFVIMVPLVLQSLWSMQLEQRISTTVKVGSVAIALIIAQAALALSFWPVRTTIIALFLTTLLYTLVGMSQQHLVGRLFAKTKFEFLGVLGLIVLLMLFTARWGNFGT